MKRSLIAICVLAGALQACDSANVPGGSVGGQPGQVGGGDSLNAQERDWIAQADGKPVSELLAAIGEIAGGRTKEQLIQALDSAFELKCHDICEVKGK